MTYDERPERRDKVPLNSADYANLGGSICPGCHKGMTVDIVRNAKWRERATPRDRTGGNRRILYILYGPLVCGNCGFEWYEKYMLIGYRVDETS